MFGRLARAGHLKKARARESASHAGATSRAYAHAALARGGPGVPTPIRNDIFGCRDDADDRMKSQLNQKKSGKGPCLGNR